MKRRKRGKRIQKEEVGGEKTKEQEILLHPKSAVWITFLST